MKILADEDYDRIIAALDRAFLYVTANSGSSSEREKVMSQLKLARLHPLQELKIVVCGGGSESGTRTATVVHGDNIGGTGGSSDGCAAGGVAIPGWNQNAYSGLGAWDGSGKDSGLGGGGGIEPNQYRGGGVRNQT